MLCGSMSPTADNQSGTRYRQDRRSPQADNFDVGAGFGAVYTLIMYMSLILKISPL